MYLPFPEENTGIIPQDAAYLKLKKIDVGRYKWKTASILKEYSPSNLNEIQVSKQADVLVLFSLLKNRFSEEILAKNWEYYEARTLHDSSLLPSVYCVTACRCSNTEEAYKMFCHAIDTDLGNNMHSSDEGLHMASLAGIWQCIVMGFGGVGITDRGLYIEPVLPEAWNSLEFSICWQNETLQITVTKEDFDVKNLTGKKVITYYHKGEKREC